ncbi:unnamed protein product [Plutella xylostella]|uniref:(diamondback moth) hypothetical protein n=1 Tax=Plutella xylostella TaxID=51655 RepID=A0A8S4G7Y4_PLUXY|nr:unnamed protein product [Plutella xylostella]
MKVNKAKVPKSKHTKQYLKEEEPKGSLFKRISKTCSKNEENYEIGCQSSCHNRNNLKYVFRCKTIHVNYYREKRNTPKLNAEDIASSTTIIKIGSIRAATDRNVQRIHLPEVETRGVGSKPVLGSRRASIHKRSSIIINNRASKCFMVSIAAATINKKISPINIPENKELHFGDDYVNHKTDVADNNVDEKKKTFGGIGDVCFPSILTKNKPENNQSQNVHADDILAEGNMPFAIPNEMVDIKMPKSKSPLRLFKGLGRKKGKTLKDMSESANNEKDVYDELTDLKTNLHEDNVTCLEKDKDRHERLKNNANFKCSFTTNRCEVKTYSDVTKNRKSKENIYYKPNREFSWLAKFMANRYDSKDNVHIRWCNQTYGHSSKTISNLKLSLCNDPDLVFKSNSKMQQPNLNTMCNDKKKSVNFLYQNVQAFMIHTIATDKPVNMVVPKNSLAISNEDKYIGVKFSEPTPFKNPTDRLLEMTDVFNSTTMVQFKNCNTRSEYIKIKIPEGFLSNTTTDENTSQEETPNNNSSTEEVCKQIVEYETLQARSKIKNKPIPTLEHGDNVVNKNLESFKICDCVKKSSTAEVEPHSFQETVVQEVILDTRSRRKMKIIGSKNYEIESHSQPSTVKAHKNCGLADIYLKDYYRNWIPAESNASSCYVSEVDRNVDLENDIVFHNMGVRRSKSCCNPGKTTKCRPSSTVSTCNISNKGSIDKMIKDTLKKIVMRSLTSKYSDYVRKVDKKIEDCVCEETLNNPKSGNHQCPNESPLPLHVMHFSSKFLTFIKNIIQEDTDSNEVRMPRRGKRCSENVSNVLTMEIKDAENDHSSVSDYLRTSQETYLSMAPGSIKGYESVNFEEASKQNPQIDINIKIDVGEHMKECNKSLSHMNIEEEGECCICSDGDEFAQSSNIDSNLTKPSEYCDDRLSNKNSARCSEVIKNSNDEMKRKKHTKDISSNIVRNKHKKSTLHEEKIISSKQESKPKSGDEFSSVFNKENDTIRCENLKCVGSASNLKCNSCNNEIQEIFSCKKSIPDSPKIDAQKVQGKRGLQCTPQSSHISSRELNRVDDFDTKSKTTDSEAISSKSLKNLHDDVTLTKAKVDTPSNNVHRNKQSEPKHIDIDKSRNHGKNKTEEPNIKASATSATKLEDTRKIESNQKKDSHTLSSEKNKMNPSLNNITKTDNFSNKNIAAKDGPDASSKTGNDARKNVPNQGTKNIIQGTNEANNVQNESKPNKNSSNLEPYIKTISGVKFINLKHFKQCECDTKGKSMTEPIKKELDASHHKDAVSPQALSDTKGKSVTEPIKKELDASHHKDAVSPQALSDTKGKSVTEPIKKELDASRHKDAVSPQALSIINTKHCSCDDKSLKPLFRSTDLTGPGSAPISVPNSRHTSRGASANSDTDSASSVSESSSSTSALSASKDNVKSKKNKKSKDRESLHNSNKRSGRRRDEEISSKASKRGSKSRRSRSRSKRRQKIRRSNESMSDINIQKSNSKKCACCCSTKTVPTQTAAPGVGSGVPKEPKKNPDLGNTSGFNIQIIPTEEPFISNKIDLITSKHKYKNEETLSRRSSKHSTKISKHRKVNMPSQGSSLYMLRRKDTPSWIVSKSKMRKHDTPSRNTSTIKLLRRDPKVSSKGFEIRKRRESKHNSRRRLHRSSSQLSDGHDDKAKGDDFHNIFNMEKKETSKLDHDACKLSVCGMCGRKRLTAAPMFIGSRSKDKNIYDIRKKRSRFRMYRAESASSTDEEEFTSRSIKRKSTEKICHSVNVGPSGSRSRIKEKSMHKSPKKSTGTTTHDSCDSDTCCVCKKKGTVKSSKKTPDMPPDCDCHTYPSKKEQERQRKGLPLDCECEENPPLTECDCKPDPPKPKKVKPQKSKSSLCDCAGEKKRREKKEKEKKQKKEKQKKDSCPGGRSCCECKGQESKKNVKSKTSQGCLCEADKKKRDEQKKAKMEKKKKKASACKEFDQCCQCDGDDDKKKKDATCVCHAEGGSRSASKTSVKKKASKEKSKSKKSKGGKCNCSKRGTAAKPIPSQPAKGQEKKDLKNAESSCFCLPEQPDPKNPSVKYKPSCQECPSNTSQLKRQLGKTDVKDKKKCKKYCFIKGPSQDSKSVDAQSLLCNECNPPSADNLFKGGDAGKKKQPDVKKSNTTIRTASVHTIIRETTGSIKITPSDNNYYPKEVKIKSYKNMPLRISSSSAVLRTTARRKPIPKNYEKDNTYISTQTIQSDQDLWKRNYAPTYIPTGSLKSEISRKGSEGSCCHSHEEVHNVMSLAVTPPMYDNRNWPKRYGKARVIPTQTFTNCNKEVVSLSTTSVSKRRSNKPARMITSRAKMKKRDRVKVIIAPKPLDKNFQTEMKTSGLGQTWVDKLKVFLNQKTAESMMQTNSSAIRAQTQIVRHSLGDKLRDIMKPRTTDTIIQTKPFVIEIKHSTSNVTKKDKPISDSHGQQHRGIFRYLSPKKVKVEKSNNVKNAYSVSSILNLPLDQRDSWKNWELSKQDHSLATSHKGTPARPTFVKIRSQSLIDMNTPKVKNTFDLSATTDPKATSRETKVNNMNLDDDYMNQQSMSKNETKISKRHCKPLQNSLNNQQNCGDEDAIEFSKPSVYLATCPRFVECDMEKDDDDGGMLKVIRLNSKETIVIGVRKQVPNRDEARNYRIYFRVSDKDGRVLVERRDWSTDDLDESASGIEPETSVMKMESGVQTTFRNQEDTISYSNSFNEAEKETSIAVNTSMVHPSFINQKIIQASNFKRDISMGTEENGESSEKKDIYLDTKNKTTSNHNLKCDEKIKLVDPHTTETMSVIRDMYKYQDDEKESIFKIPVKDASISADSISNSSVFEISLSLKVYPGNKNEPVAKVTQKQIDKPARVASELLEKIKNQSADDIYTVSVLPDRPVHCPSNGINIRIVMKRNNNCTTEIEKLKAPIAEVYTTCKNKVKSLKTPIKTKTEKKIKAHKASSKELNEYNYDTDITSIEDLNNSAEAQSNDNNYYFHRNVVISFVDCGKTSKSDIMEDDSFVAEPKDSKLREQLKDMQLVLRLSLTADAVTQLDDCDNCEINTTVSSSQMNALKVEDNDNLDFRNTSIESRALDTQLREPNKRCSNIDLYDKTAIDDECQYIYTAFTVHQKGPFQSKTESNDDNHKVCTSTGCDMSLDGSESDEKNLTPRNIEVINVCTQCRNGPRDPTVPTFGVKEASWRTEHELEVKNQSMPRQFRSHGRYLKLFSINKLNKSVLGISSDDEIVFLEKVPNEDLKRYKKKMRKSDKRDLNVFNVTADILQTNEAKKAVLALYEDKIKMENGDQIISNLPKFVG